MSLPLAVGAHPVGIQQRISGGSKFDGTAPTGPLAYSNGINKYGAASAGGLFYFENTRPIMLTQYNMDFGEAVSYEVAVVSLDKAGAKVAGERLVIDAGSGRYARGPAYYAFCLGAGQALEVTVSTARSGSSPAMIGAVWAIDATAALA